jgi:AmmeMemoRadiSam system protein B
MMKTTPDLRPSPIAGQWYAGNANRLAASVDAFIRGAALPEIDGKIIAIIVPHAGHVYSGQVAGYAFRAIRGMAPDLVAVISPMHQPYFEPLLTSDHDAYQTPLGAVPIDRDLVKALDTMLTTEVGIRITPVREDREHSLEIELPFLQRALGDEFSLLPIMVRDQSAQVTQALGESLGRLLKDRNALLVASTDLSHFYTQVVAEKYDKEMLTRIEAFDPAAVLQAESDKKGFACGRGAVATVLWASRELGADDVKILNYATSGDVSGDYHQVVGYGAAVITQSKKEA